MESIWHIGIAVPDLEQGKQELGEVFGLRWRPDRVRKLTLADAAGRPYEVECHVTFSLGGPFAVEAWQAIPGTPLDMPDGGGVHHIGYWVDDLAAEAKRLDALGYPNYATAGTTPLLIRGPAGTLVELCDLHSDRPSLRDLFPPGSEFAGHTPPASQIHPELSQSFRLVGIRK
jgi:catechol 2,3-dioxygenase-like lactoylglutathione lyase family enzyme